MIRRASFPGALILILASLAAAAGAQDFVAPAVAGPSPSPLAFLERGLPGSAAPPSLAGAVVRWYGLADLTTRALALGAPWRSWRAAVGISQTGEPELGWSAMALACGAAQRAGGAGLRFAARRDRDPPLQGGPLGRGVGAEGGGGAWVEAGGGLLLWASAAQLWTRGASPPLARGLELGGAARGGGVVVWLQRVAPARSGAGAARVAGIGLEGPSFKLWLEGRDRPLRGGAGLEARAGAVTVALGIDGHPVLGETLRLSLGLEPARDRR